MRGPVRALQCLDVGMSRSSRRLQRSGYTPMFDDDVAGLIGMFEDDFERCRAGCVGICRFVRADVAPDGFFADPDGVHEPVMQMVQAMRITTMLLLTYQLIPGGRQTIAQLRIEDMVFKHDGMSVLVPERIGSGGKRIGSRIMIPRDPRRVLCPVSAASAWVELLAEEGIVSGPLFRAVNRHRNTYMRGSVHNPAKPGENLELSDSGLDLIVRGTCDKAVKRGYLRAGKWGLMSFVLGASARAVRYGNGIELVADVLNVTSQTVSEMVHLDQMAA